MVSSELTKLIDTVLKEGASDLHISPGRPPTVRVAGHLIPLTNFGTLSAEAVEGMLNNLMPDEKKKEFFATKEADFSHDAGAARFRGNAYFQRGEIGIALRLIPKQIKTVAELSLPDFLVDFARKKQGFFLVVGPVGSGKSTTLASLLELINQERAEHIITIEDPIEYLFESKNSIIEQREVRVDTADFDAALRSAFRQDVDVLMVGEMRSRETIATAVTAAETGHLVFSTLHTNDASQTIDRIIDTFPPEAQNQLRVQLAASLLGIFSQRLIPRISGGQVPAYELLINNKAVANLIREGRTHELASYIETGAEAGMISMNKTLAELVRRGEITPADALQFASDPRSLERLI